MRKIVLWGFGALLLCTAYVAYRMVWGQPFTLRLLADRQVLQMLVRDPEIFSQIGAIDGTVFDRHSNQLSAVGIAAREQEYAFAERSLAEIQQFDRAALTPADQVSHDVLVDFYSTIVAGREFEWLSSGYLFNGGIYPVSPMFGLQVGIVKFMQSTHVVRNERSARNYVARLYAVEKKLDAISAEARRQSDAGVVLPPALLERSLAVIDDTIAPAPEANLLLTGFVARLEQVAELDEQERSELRAAALQALNEAVYPAYRRMREELAKDRARAQGVAAGVGRLADGEAFYRMMLRRFTTTEYSPQQVHQLGLDEVARISAEMDRLLQSQGIDEGSVGQRMTALSADPRFLFADNESGREQVLTRFREILADMDTRLAEVFRDIPAAKVAVERVPEAAQQGSAGAYYMPPSLDGSRVGTFFLNLRDLREHPTWGMKTLAYHEGVPGHHFQIAAAQQLKNLPMLRQQPVYAAYSEGWALYSERLAAEMGLYAGDPFGDLGRLKAELFRAVRLVVDTGLHAKGWSREQAIAYMLEVTGNEEVTEIERYMALPGQACAYKIGQLKILELRERARAALGAAFDLREFHAVVLGNGAVPLVVLERLVDEWIAQQLAG